MTYFLLGVVVFLLSWVALLIHRLKRRPESTARVYFIRHQAAGVLYQFPFAAPPTKAQLAAMQGGMAKLHVRAAGKDPWWLQIVESPLLDTQTLPVLATPAPAQRMGAEAALPQFKVSATGVARPPPPPPRRLTK